MASLRLSGVTVTEPELGRALLDSVTLSAEAGELVAVIGASGGGKTTLLEVAAGLREPDAGTETGGDGAAIAFQAPERMFFEATVHDEIAFALRGAGLDAGALRERVVHALAEVGLDAEYLERHPFTLSGGEQRLVALAAVLVGAPPVILLDEPTAGLAAEHAERVLALIRDRARRGAVVLVATHEVDDVIPIADRVIALHRGTVVADGRPEDVFTAFGVARLVDLGVPVPLRALAGGGVSALPSMPASTDAPVAVRGGRRWRVPPPGVAAGMVVALLLALTFFLGAPLGVLAGIALAAPLVALLTGAALRGSARLLLPLALLASFATVGHLVTAEGEALIALGPVEVTRAGLDAAARTWLRIIGPVLVGLAVTGGRSPVEVARELRRLLAAAPVARRLAAETALAVLLVVRLAPLMRGEVRRIERAQRARGGARAGRGLGRVRSLMSLAVPAIVMTLLRAERLALALELRGWSGELRARGAVLRALDLGWLAVAGVVLAGVLASA